MVVPEIQGDEVLFEGTIPDSWAMQLRGASGTREVIITRHREGHLGLHIYVNDNGLLHLHPNIDQYQCIVAAMLKEITRLKNTDK